MVVILAKVKDGGNMEEKYAIVGAEVILGEHDWRDNWCSAMDQYIGVKTKIISIYGRDRSKCLCCYVDCDGGRYIWRVTNMIRVEPTYQELPVCIECMIPNPYAQVMVGEEYFCRACSLRKEYVFGKE